MLMPFNVTTADEPNFQELLNVIPLSCLVLTSEFMIVGVNDAHALLAGVGREHLLGKNIFVAFPDNPDDPQPTGSANLRASLNRVLQTGVADTMATQGYDIAVTDDSGTKFEVRYWSAVNIPIVGSEGKLTHILHRTEEITAEIKNQVRATEMESLISAQALMIAHQEQFSTLFQQAPMFMAMLVGPEHRFSFANEAYRQLIGHREVEGRTVKGALPEAAVLSH